MVELVCYYVAGQVGASGKSIKRLKTKTEEREKTEILVQCFWPSFNLFSLDTLKKIV
jgi:hypothetical protein